VVMATQAPFGALDRSAACYRRRMLSREHPSAAA
jgi:hypothetical protein